MGMTEPSRRERYLKALEIAERHGNRFMAANIRAELRKLDTEPNYPAKPDSSTL